MKVMSRLMLIRNMHPLGGGGYLLPLPFLVTRPITRVKSQYELARDRLSLPGRKAIANCKIHRT